jgi:hypothetical protein
MKSRDWTCWSYWILFSIFDLIIGTLLPKADVSSTSIRFLHIISWALVFAIGAGLVRCWMIWRKSSWPGHWTLFSYAFILVNLEIVGFVLLSLYLSPLSPDEIQHLMLDTGAGMAFGGVTGWIVSLFVAPTLANA